jgi:hypothetical protein
MTLATVSLPQVTLPSLITQRVADQTSNNVDLFFVLEDT